MINDNRKYDTRDFRRNEKGSSYRNRIAALQKIFVTLAAAAVVMGLVLVGAIIGRRNAFTEASGDGSVPSGVASLHSC